MSAENSFTHKLTPANWTRKTRIIAIITAIILALTGTCVGVAYSHYAHERNCATQRQAFDNEKNVSRQASQDAKDALATIDPSVKEGEGTRLSHTDGFPASDDDHKAVDELNATLAAVEPQIEVETPACPALADNEVRAKNVTSLKERTAAFVAARDAYRLDKASKEANESMDKAKNDLAEAQKNASEQIGAVDADTSLQSDENVKKAYDALKIVEGESHTLSTNVSTETYDEAVASIERAKTVASKAGDVNNATNALKDAINARREAQAAAAAAASQNASSNGGSTRSYGSTGGSQSRSYSNGGGGSSSGGGSSYSNSGSGNTGGSTSSHKMSNDEILKHSVSREEADSGRYSYCVIIGNGRYLCS